MSETEGKFYGYMEGKPTRPDVDLLIKSFPDLKVGDKIAYEHVAEIVGVQVEQTRFKTVTTAWRKRLLEEHRIVLECIKNSHYYVASANDVSADTYDVLTRIARKSKRHRAKLLAVKTDNQDQRSTIHHQAQLMHQLETDVKKQRKNILPDTSAKEIVRAAPR